MRALLASIYNAIVNLGGTNTGGIYPDLAAGVTVTSGKSYAYGSFAQVVAAATVTVASWLTHVIVDVFYIATGEAYQAQIGTGASGSEAAMTGSTWRVGHQEASAVGELPYQVWSFSPYPLYVAAATRLSARAAAASANNRSLGVSVAYRSGIGS